MKSAAFVLRVSDFLDLLVAAEKKKRPERAPGLSQAASEQNKKMYTFNMFAEGEPSVASPRKATRHYYDLTAHYTHSPIIRCSIVSDGTLNTEHTGIVRRFWSCRVRCRLRVKCHSFSSRSRYSRQQYQWLQGDVLYCTLNGNNTRARSSSHPGNTHSEKMWPLYRRD